MRDIIRIALLVINIISFVCICIIAIFICYCEFFGYDNGNDFLRRINFPLDYNGIIHPSFICIAILIVSHTLRKKFFG